VTPRSGASARGREVWEKTQTQKKTKQKKRTSQQGPSAAWDNLKDRKEALKGKSKVTGEGSILSKLSEEDIHWSEIHSEFLRVWLKGKRGGGGRKDIGKAQVGNR